jgi:uncharacterized membrane protein (Fun14 family)
MFTVTVIARNEAIANYTERICQLGIASLLAMAISYSIKKATQSGAAFNNQN